VKRASATLNPATLTCGTFGSFTTRALVGGADTSVVSGQCYQYTYTVLDNVGNTVTYTSANVARVDTAGPRVTGIVSHQSNGSAGDGRLQVGDKLILTFDQELVPASVPGSFTGATETWPALFTTTKLTIPGITDGPVDTGALGYLFIWGSTATFGGTTALVNSGASTTVTISVTSLSGATTAASNGALAFKPAPTITDPGGNPAGGTFTTPSTFKLF
jgi:hypothetical protein